ncbi:hypothetical protein NESM_000857800 [Novymonas esmeraldas]|uniref:CHASE domain-containing protein n=1 Tax=Novymonas esmeraldas TaxID=1808958 RepID=A0AAW0F0I7_9TRYP
MKKIFQTPTGNTAEDEQNNKRHAKRYRVYLIILAVWVAFLLILITILTPMLVLQRQDSDLEMVHRDEEAALANNYTTQFRDSILGAISAVYGVEGYIMGEMKTLPQLNATPAERVVGQYFPMFYSYAELVASSSSSIALFATAPGGVILQAYPKLAELSIDGWDLMNSSGYGVNYTDPGAAQRTDPMETVNSGVLALTGPYHGAGLPIVDDSGELEAVSDVWWVDLHQPIYNATSTATISSATFWGFAIVALAVDGLIRDKGFPAAMDSSMMAYVVYTIIGNTSSTCSVIMASSAFGNQTDCNTKDMQDFINDATTRDVLKEQLSWKISLKSTKRVNQLTTEVRNAIVISSVVGVLLVFALCVYLIVRCTRVYDGSVHAPKMAPFAMLTIGPCRGEELWDLASDQMVEVTEQLGQVLARQMVKHHAYQIQQVHPLTTSYVTRSVAAAVQMAFGTIEELHSDPIDDPLRRLLGDDGCLLLSYAVHWCTDAAVRVESLGGGLRYDGPDVVYGGRMWVFAGPNVVTVSPAALPSTMRMAHLKSRLFDSVFLRGVTTRQDLYVVTDTTDHRLKEAEAVAAEQVRRAREAQLQYAADKEAEPGSSDYAHRDRLLTSYPRTGYNGTSDLDGTSFFARGTGGTGGVLGSGGSSSQPSSNGDGDGRGGLAGARGGASGGVVVTRKDGVVGVCGVPTAIMVPSSSAEHALAGDGGPSQRSPTSSALELERRMVRRPARPRSAANVVSASSTSSSSAVNTRADREVDLAAAQLAWRAPVHPSASYSVHTPQTPPLQPLTSGTPGAAADHGARHHRSYPPLHSAHPAPHSSSSGSGSGGGGGSAVRHSDLLPTNPFVVVPPSAKVIAALHGLGGGGVGGGGVGGGGGGGIAAGVGGGVGGGVGPASTTTVSSDESNGGRRGGNALPTSVYDNPLAHDMNMAAAAAKANAPGGGGAAAIGGSTLVACTSNNNDGSAAMHGSAPAVDTFSTDLLLRPAISTQADLLLRTVFDRQAVALDVSYDSVRVLVYYFYCSYKILFRPLAAPELHNIYRRLMAAFGVPHQGILEHLAARCAIRFLQRHEETQTLLWDQQHRLQAHNRSASVGTHTNTTTTASVSDEGAASISA